MVYLQSIGCLVFTNFLRADAFSKNLNLGRYCNIYLDAKIFSSDATSPSSTLSLGLLNSLSTLQDFNNQYLLRMKQGRAEGKSPKRVELDRAQVLKTEGIRAERELLRSAVQSVRSVSSEISLGIMCETGSLAIQTLKAWVQGLNLSHGELHCVSDAGASIPAISLQESPVYIKYNSSDPHNAYMKPYKSEGFIGVIFQPVLADGEFRQFGDLPLKLYN